MDIWATNGSFAVAAMGFVSYKTAWNKDKTLSVWEVDGKYKTGVVVVQTGRGDFIEAINDVGDVVWQGGDGEWCHVPISKKPIRLRFRKLPRPGLSKHGFEKARRKVTRYLVSDSPYSAGIQGKLTGSIKWMNKKLLEIPKDCRASAQIEFRNRHEYGESYEHVEITFQQPETDDELMWRLTVEAERARVALAEKKASFEKLKSELAHADA